VVLRLENDPATSIDILHGYDRVLVIDGDIRGFFKESAFSKWLVIDNSTETEGIRIWRCHPRFGTTATADAVRQVPAIWIRLNL